jgi:hypothetical protein
MIEKRKYYRINLTADAKVYHNGCHHEGTLSSISLGGASVNFNDSAMIPQGDICYISFNILDSPMKFKANIVNSSIYRLGVTFIDMKYEQSIMLSELLMKLAFAPDLQQFDNSIYIAI